MKMTKLGAGHLLVILAFFAYYINSFYKTEVSDGHFEGPNMSKSELDEKVQHKSQI
jgi:hypothetical protein